MSKFSGKCDLADVIAIHQITDFSKLMIYAYGNDIVPLRIDCKKDLVPYYPYLVVAMTGSSDGATIIHLSEKSHVDTEEAEYLTWILDSVKRYWTRCKRKKQPFDREEALQKAAWFNVQDYHEELVDRVESLGKKATIEGIHVPMYDKLRQQLYDEMIKAGWDESSSYKWCFGWHRWLLKIL